MYQNVARIISDNQMCDKQSKRTTCLKCPLIKANHPEKRPRHQTAGADDVQ